MILKVSNLKKHYPVRKTFQKTRWVKALDGVSFELDENETLAIVGESGCGKSTLAKVLMQLEPETSGEIELEGENLKNISGQNFRKKMQKNFLS